jgi:hypothetical protein
MKVTADVQNASTCVWSGEWRGTSASANATPVNCAGLVSVAVTASELVTLPVNGSDASRTWTVFLIANGPGGTSGWAHVDIVQQGQSIPAITPTTDRITATPTPTAVSATASSNSTNWSGYVLLSSSRVTAVGAQWTVPTLDCSATPNNGVAIWVGIDGHYLSTGQTVGALLQTGITMLCVEGKPQDHGFFEKLPSTPNVSRPFVDFPVSPGDSIRASVFRGANGAWFTRVDDLTTGLSGVMVTGEAWGVGRDSELSSVGFLGQGSTVGLSYSGGYSAEWIVEDFTIGRAGSFVPLAHYGTVRFTKLTTSLSSWSLSARESIAIFQDGLLVSRPSAASNAAFSVRYTG